MAVQKKKTGIYKSAVVVKEIWQCYSKTSVQNLGDKRTIKLAQASMSIINLNLNKIKGSLTNILELIDLKQRKVICTRKSLEMQIGQKILSIGWNRYGQIIIT